jgi:hypothetical protein
MQEATMDDELFRALYQIATRLWPHREKNLQFSGRLILLMYLWSVIRRKPRGWVCDGRHLPPLLQQTPTPSPSQFRRRLKEPLFAQMLSEMENHCRGRPSERLLGCWLVDAKPLPVSPYSKDKEAKWGWAYDRKARGYKFFAMTDAEQRIVAWQLHPMNASEPVVARTLLEATDRPGYLLGDSIYDSGPLHELAAERDLQLIAPRKEPGGNIGPRARQPTRLHAIDLLETFCNRFGPSLYAQRTDIERIFSLLACSRIGLDNLPPFVRKLERVRPWVQGKIILYSVLKQKELQS